MSVCVSDITGSMPHFQYRTGMNVPYNKFEFLIVTLFEKDSSSNNTNHLNCRITIICPIVYCVQTIEMQSERKDCIADEVTTSISHSRFVTSSYPVAVSFPHLRSETVIRFDNYNNFVYYLKCLIQPGRFFSHCVVHCCLFLLHSLISTPPSHKYWGGNRVLDKGRFFRKSGWFFNWYTEGGEACRGDALRRTLFPWHLDCRQTFFEWSQWDF